MEKYQNIFPSSVLHLTLKRTINKQTDVNLLVELDESVGLQKSLEFTVCEP